MKENYTNIDLALRGAKKKVQFFEAGTTFFFPTEYNHVYVVDKGASDVGNYDFVFNFDFGSYDPNSKFKFEDGAPLDPAILLEVKYTEKHLERVKNDPNELVLFINFGKDWKEKKDVDKIIYPPGGKWVGAHRFLITTWNDPMVAWGP